MSILRKLSPEKFKSPEEIPPKDSPQSRIRDNSPAEKLQAEIMDTYASIELKNEAARYIRLMRILAILSITLPVLYCLVIPLAFCLLAAFIPSFLESIYYIFFPQGSGIL